MLSFAGGRWRQSAHELGWASALLAHWRVAVERQGTMIDIKLDHLPTPSEAARCVSQSSRAVLLCS